MQHMQHICNIYAASESFLVSVMNFEPADETTVEIIRGNISDDVNIAIRDLQQYQF